MCTQHHSKTFACVLVGTCGMFLSAGPAAGHVLLNEPNGGEFLEVGSVVTIEWQIEIVHNLLNWDLWYSTTGADGPWITIQMDLPPGSPAVGSIHTYNWTVPDDPSGQVRVRVRMDNSATDYFDISDANLSIGTPGVCNDGDNDGYGSPGDPSCPNGAAGDCDDGDPDINPGAEEVCDDFTDNDCDELTDGDDSDCGGPTTHHVVQVGLTFDPADVVVTSGDTIEWHWTDGVHTVTSGPPCTPDGRFNEPLDSANQVITYTVPLDEPGGVIPYFCIPHCLVDMTGTITVRGPLPVDPGTSNDRRKNRYISFKPNNTVGQTVKLEVTLTASFPHPGLVGSSWWVKGPVPPGNPLLPPGECVALLGPEATAADIDWVSLGCTVLHVTGCPIEPTSGYDVRSVADLSVSGPLAVPTSLQPAEGKFWGDTVNDFNGVEWTAPNGVTNITDVVVAIRTFHGGAVVAPIPGVPIAHLSVVDVDPGNINLVVNFDDVFKLVQAFIADPYPFGPADGE